MLFARQSFIIARLANARRGNLLSGGYEFKFREYFDIKNLR